MKTTLTKIIWIIIAIFSTLFVLNGLIHLPFYIAADSAFFSAYKLFVLGFAILGAFSFGLSVKKLNQPTLKKT